MNITPDTKDWTWVLQRPCPDCGVDVRLLNPKDVPRLLRENTAEWAVILAGSEDVRKRPSPDVWSPLEYACHVRDVFRIFDSRLQRMLTEDAPLFKNWDQNETAIAERYGEQDPAVVSDEVQAAAEQLATRISGVPDDAWFRPGRRSDGARFLAITLVRYLMHDPIHHIYDVTGRRYGDMAR